MNTEHYEGCCAGQQFLFITHRDHTSPDKALVDVSENYQINEEVPSMPQVEHSKRLQSNINVLCYKSRAAVQVWDMGHWDSAARGGLCLQTLPGRKYSQKACITFRAMWGDSGAVNTTARDI